VRVSFVVINKDDAAVAETLTALEAQRADGVTATETVVVDASEGRLDAIRDAHPGVVWVPFAPQPGKPTIPEQRNVGIARASGDVVVFIDASCEPQADWLARLIAPILDEGEHVVAGSTLSTGAPSLRDENAHFAGDERYIREAPTINLAVRREVFATVGVFDEAFHYGSDVDFTWRVVDAGLRIRYVPGAIVRHDWGDARSEVRRSYLYGQARYRLYAKHAHRRGGALREDPIAVVYPLVLLALPLLLRRPWRLAILAVPLLRNRGHRPVLSLVDHLVYGAGVLRAARDHATGRLGS
jgi:glycosyltransferase involved in cell wall biosynthesis